jgi:hypothetical protein
VRWGCRSSKSKLASVTATLRLVRLKGYADFIVQDLVIRPHVVNFRRKRCSNRTPSRSSNCRIE